MLSVKLPESYDKRLPPDARLVRRKTTRRVNLLSNIRFSIGNVRVVCKLEITKFDDREPTAALPVAGPDHRQERRRALGPMTPGSPRSSRASALRAFHQDRMTRLPHQRYAPGSAFWETLDPAERRALLAVAFVRKYAAGTRLMRGDSQADHVLMILSGRAGICIRENGVDLILAERGPGQLVGECDALPVNMRPASVIALETVRALVILTGDFSAFIGAHPAVFKFVEGRSRGGLAGSPACLPRALNGENCTVILSDVVGFGAQARTDEDRRIIREALFSMTHAALRDLPDVWSCDDRGDGLLTVVPPSVPTALVIRHLHKQLPASLEEHNREHRDPARIRLRVAINVGPVVTDTIGVSGEAIIVTARLVEAPPFKEAMVTSQAALGIITSAFIYDNVTRHELGLSGYCRVQADVKESSLQAWMKIFGKPGESGDNGREWLRPAEELSGPRAAVPSGSGLF